jgi:RNA-binding protein YhbY
MKTLDEIETDYVNNIIEYFCKEMPIHIKFNKHSEMKKAELIQRISNQIDHRLLNNHLVKNYLVKVNVYPKDERRDTQIENLIENKNIPLPEDHISVCIDRKGISGFYELKYKI